MEIIAELKLVDMKSVLLYWEGGFYHVSYDVHPVEKYEYIDQAYDAFSKMCQKQWDDYR